MIRTSRSPVLLLVAGLIGLSAYAVVTRPGSPAAQMSDAVRGVWVGVCLGLETLAVILLRRARGGSAA